ncbi:MULTISPECIES: hypothetical protein [Pseudomonas]|uniref:hypothetical protein n=1 Tax=Pseudomonas TaxID=286 RepID=UPI0027358C02|nr:MULTISPECIES: hypothetical protein [Pseudomonas]MDR8363112.1 hypothetical protein [Pseudomonas sp. JL3]WLG92977.1 hypothetical protein PSH72_13205 [Pseudomonas cucumis]
MAPDGTTKALLARHFGNLPGPEKETYDVAQALSEVLKHNGVYTPGVVAVCWSAQGYWYTAVSPDIQRNIKAVAGAVGVTNWLFCATRLAIDATNYNYEQGICACTTTLPVISGNYANPGCAEKKIISSVHRWGDVIEQLSLIGHPDIDNTRVLHSYVAVGDKHGAYLAPCSSCLQVAKIYAQ